MGSSNSPTAQHEHPRGPTESKPWTAAWCRPPLPTSLSTGATSTKLAFTSNSLTGTASGSASLGPITVQEEDAYGDPVPTTTPVTVSLSSSSTGPNEFAAASGGAAITSVTIPANSSSATFYYGDTKAGSPTPHGVGSRLGVRGPSPRRSPRRQPPSSPSRSSPLTRGLEQFCHNSVQRHSRGHLRQRDHEDQRHHGEPDFDVLPVPSSQPPRAGRRVTSVNLPANTSSVTASTATRMSARRRSPRPRRVSTSGSQPETITTGPTKLVLTGPAAGSASATASLGPFTVTEEAANGTPTTVGETVNLTSSSVGTTSSTPRKDPPGPPGRRASPSRTANPRPPSTTATPKPTTRPSRRR